MIESLKSFEFNFPLFDESLDDTEYWPKYVTKRNEEEKQGITSPKHFSPLKLNTPKVSPLSSKVGWSNSPSAEAIQNIISQAQETEQELSRMRQENLQLSTEKRMVKEQYEKLQQDYERLKMDLKQKEAEVEIYKNGIENINEQKKTHSTDLDHIDPQVFQKGSLLIPVSFDSENDASDEPLVDFQNFDIVLSEKFTQIYEGLLELREIDENLISKLQPDHSTKKVWREKDELFQRENLNCVLEEI